MSKPQTWCSNQNASSRLPFVFISLVAWILVVVTDSAPQQTDVSPAEYLPIPQSQLLANLKVEARSGTEVLLSWDPPVNNETTAKYRIQLEYLSDTDPKASENFLVDDNRFLLNSLEPGSSYAVRIYLEDDSQLFIPLEANFSTRPDPPERFVVWYRNETALLIYWQPPTGIFDSYKAEISPREGAESTLVVSKEDYQTGELTPGFYDLTPGKAYNISVKTTSGSLESSPLIKEYRTIPLKPQNLTVTVVELKDRPSSITVHWIPPPEDEGDYDGFSVYINHPGSKPMQKFVSRTKPSRAHLADPSLEIGETYEVMVKTVSGKVSSTPVSHNFTYIPKPVL